MPSSYTTDLPNDILLDTAILYWNNGDGVYNGGDVQKSSEPEDFKTTRTLRYRISSTNYEKAALDGIDFTTGHVITASKWGVILVEIDTSGNFASKVPASTQAYNTEAEAVAAVPSVTTNKARVGYWLIQNNTGDWTANTDDLTNGSDLTSATFVPIYDGMTKLGATRGGITFNKNAEWRNVPFDGASGETAGLSRKTGGTPTLEGTTILFGPTALAELVEPGSTAVTVGTDPNAIRRITPLAHRTMLGVTSLHRYEALWKRGNGGTAKVIFPLGMPDFASVGAQDNNEGEIPFTIRAQNDPDDIDGNDEVPTPYYIELTGPDITVA